MVGLDAAVQSLCEKYEEETDMLVDFVEEGDANFIGINLRGTLYRMVRELLHNIAKHAWAEQVTVSLTTTEGAIEIRVEDNGIGFDATEVLLQGNRNHSIGLFSIKQRIEYLGGSMTMDSQRGAGTRVTLRVPSQSELPWENGGI
jgi:signal transduction histidine kinase